MNIITVDEIWIYGLCTHAFGHLPWKRKCDKRVLHVSTLGITAKNWHHLSVRNFFHGCRYSGVTSYPKTFSHAALVLARKLELNILWTYLRFYLHIYILSVLTVFKLNDKDSHVWSWPMMSFLIKFKAIFLLTIRFLVVYLVKFEIKPSDFTKNKHLNEWKIQHFVIV